MKVKSIYLVLAAFAVSISIPFPASAQFGKMMKKKTETKDSSAQLREEMGEYKGVKHALGVSKFENQANWRGQWELGDNMALMLESALFDSGRFVVLERQDLQTVFSEQDLQASGRAAESSTVAQTGLIRSAKYMATGAVTRVDQNTSGDSGGIGFQGVRIGGSKKKATIELVVKLIDTTSGQVVASQRVEGKAGSSKLKVGFYKRGVSGSLGGFEKTSLGEAAQDCIVQAVMFIASEMEDFKVTANVVMAKSEKMIVINRGEDYGVEVGNSFSIREKGEVLTDPDTGEILDVFEGEVLGKVKVNRVSEKVSYCELIEGVMPKRGDSLEFDS